MDIYQRGRSYFQNGRVKRLMYGRKDDKYVAVVQGTNNYTVEIWTDDQGKLKNYSCTCPAFNRMWGFCKHTVAALLALEGNMKLREERDKAQAKALMGEILNNFTIDTHAPHREVVLEPTLHLEIMGDVTKSSVSLNIGEDRLYVVKSFKSFIQEILAGESIYFGKKFTYNPRVHNFSLADQEMISLFSEIYQVVYSDDAFQPYKLSSTSYITSSTYNRQGDSLFSGKALTLPEIHLKRWLKIMEKSGRAIPVFVHGQGLHEHVTVREEDLPLEFYLEEKEDCLFLGENNLKQILPLTRDGEFVFAYGHIYHLSLKQRQNLMPFYRGFAANLGDGLIIPEEDKEILVSELLPRIKKTGRLVIHEELAQKIQERPLKTEVYLDTDGSGDKIIAEVKFIYGDRVINPFPGIGVSTNSTNPSTSPTDPGNDDGKDEDEDHHHESLDDDFIILRDSEGEHRVISCFENSGFHVLGTQVYLEGEEDIFQFITVYLPELLKEGDVFYSDSFRSLAKRPAPAFKGRVYLNGETDLLELDFELEGISGDELFDLYGALKEKKKYYRLKDGGFLSLVGGELEDMAELLDGLELKKEDFARGHVELPKFRSLYLDDLIHKNRLGRFKKDKAFRELVQNVRDPEDTDFSLPPHLDAVLRDYQKTGFKWLKTLASYGFGGILADDMGLGKTLETISFIESERENDRAPALVIAPTSVVFNWQGEIEKFAPGLKTMVITGTKAERRELLEQLDGARVVPGRRFPDVVITSYPLIRNDISLYRDLTFSACILDEAQYIKNANSLTARAVKMISARKYFALTGTPIENSLAELWSIFDFLMPGYLPGYNKFAKQYIAPLKKDDGNQVLEDLARKVSPFILRRLKKDVVEELPEKIELKMVSELTREQKKVYLAYLGKIKKDIAGEIAQKGFDKSRIKILAGLTRLRQICCHPSLFLENFKGESGKLIQLQEVLADLRAGGHRCLLFSQFTSMLAIIREMLDRENYRYFYLDGSVESKERVAMADAFNRGDEDLFLISLKAGGTGLNLTGADTVIHFDPWWNPAVEDQATDRAHRIGQDKVVNVLKFISLGTIEEKIFELQQKKKNLINEVIKPGETFLSQLNEKEIREILEI
ncbi:MAG: SNF2 helicase associated domain-containing protein [Bacillota bacterium]